MEKHELRNFIPISRRLFQHQLWCEARAFSKFEAWIYLLKEARFEDTRVYDGATPVDVERGQIYASVRFLAQAFGWSRTKTLNFIKLLQADGMVRKEIVNGTGQMRLTICNYDVYNARADTAKTLERQCGDSRETKSNIENKDKSENTASTDGLTWRESYEIYLKEAKDALDRLLTDDDFVKGRERFRPNLDIRLSLQKAYEDYWQTREAWERRRKLRKKELDWRATFRNALDIPQNWVTRGLTGKLRNNKKNQLFDSKENNAKFEESM